MKISILIPSYNQKEYLAEAIDSALAQTIRSEVIVIDDGSTDGSLQIAKSYEPFKVKVIEQVNKGLASARNTGIMNASGDYILPLDADDILKDNCVERILEVIEKTNADVVAPSIHCFGLAEQTTILMADPKLEDFKVVNGQPQNRLAYCAAIKKEALLEIGGYSPRMTWGAEDYHLWINLLIRGKKIVTIPEPLMFYRTKTESMWNETKKYQKEFIEQIFKDFPEFAKL